MGESVAQYARYSDLRSYLFGEVSTKYKKEKTLSTFDFFCIIIWKANRSKSRVATRLLKGDRCGNLDSAVAALVKQVTNASDNKERLRVLVEKWGFRLPMASAILTVLFPNEFTIYDFRVLESLQGFKDAQNTKQFETLWKCYSEYVKRIRKLVPEVPVLRDKDQCLWGKSWAEHLKQDIKKQFRKPAGSKP